MLTNEKGDAEMAKNESIMMKGRSASSFIAQAKNPNSNVRAKTNAYFNYVTDTTTVSQSGGVIRIHSSGERFSPK